MNQRSPDNPPAAAPVARPAPGRRRLRLTLGVRLALIIAALVATMGVANTVYLETRVFSQMEDELEHRWLLMARYLAGESVDFVLYQDRLRLEELLGKARAVDPDFTYCFVLDPAHRVLAHTFSGDFPDALRTINVPPSSGAGPPGDRILRIDLFGQRYRDFAVPIHRGDLGTLRLGIRDRTITERLDDIRRGLLLVVLPAVVLGGLVAFGVARMLRRRLHPITDTLARFEPGRHREPIPVTRDDELGDVAREVNAITERLHDAQKSLLRSEKLASIGTMASGIAHEINNPITGLQNCLARVQAAPDNVEQTREYAGLMVETVHHLDETVRRLLEFARSSTVRHERVDLGDVVRRAIGLVAFQLSRDRVDIALRVPESPVCVDGDDNRLMQLVVNLALNALDAMPEGGALTVALTSEGHTVALRVRDTGVGMAPDVVDRIFDPFFTTKDAGKGTGLGLAVAHRVVHDHGGDVRVSSRPGGGSEFVVELPASTAPGGERSGDGHR